VATLLFLGLSTLLLLSNLPWMILSTLTHEYSDIEAWVASHFAYVVVSQIVTLTYSKTLFTLAIAVNSTRWAFLIATMKTQSGELQRRLF
jgi:hypothetical protein